MEYVAISKYSTDLSFTCLLFPFYFLSLNNDIVFEKFPEAIKVWLVKALKIFNVKITTASIFFKTNNFLTYFISLHSDSIPIY